MFQKRIGLNKTCLVVCFTFIGLICSWGTFPAYAEQIDLDAVLGGFEDAEDFGGNVVVETDPAARESASSFVSLNGFFKLGTSYNVAHGKPAEGGVDWRGLSRLRPELQLESTANLPGSWKAFVSRKGSYDVVYKLKGRDEFTSDMLDHYENELELRQAYLQGSLFDRLDIKAGRQIVVWGKSDSIRVTDVINPLDTREFGMTDIEDLRVPIGMDRVDYAFGHWTLTGIAIHEIRFNKQAEYGSDFYPGAAPPPYEDIPPDALKNTEFGVALSGMFQGWDLAFYWADVFNDAPHTEVVSPGFSPQTELRHARLSMLGAAANVVQGNWLLKAEAAHFDGFAFLRDPGQTYRRTDVLAGFEYSGLTDMTISVEAVNRHLHDFDAALAQSPDNAQNDEFQTAVRISRTLWRQSLTLTAQASAFGLTGQDGALQRISAEYDLNDAVQVGGGLVFYQSGNLARFSRIGDNDRVFFEMIYSF